MFFMPLGGYGLMVPQCKCVISVAFDSEQLCFGLCFMVCTGGKVPHSCASGIC